MKIHIKYIILFDDGLRYYYSEDPGIAVSEFSEVRGTSEDQETRAFKSYSFFNFEYEYNDTTTIDNLAKKIMDKMDYNINKAQRFGHIPINIFLSNQLILCENLNYNFKELLDFYGAKDEIAVFFIYSHKAGAIWDVKDDGLEYYMNSHEAGRHNLPHVHVLYHSEESASISIENGKILAGYLPNRALKKARKKIASNQSFLYECWNKLTDGLRVDINYAFGKRSIENTSGLF